ncbi:MAG: glycosyltransferase family 2 protein, partial [Nitrospinae bacterium]|nr:glycosyltransferase family 2 protein [Nitrospinota bacterium]
MNNKNPKISVIIPAYNRAYCLGETIDSVLAQTYRDYELIVVDDGSTDNTHSLVQAVRGIKYLRIAENSGVSMARNLGIRNARGKYICFLDSDDLWVNTKLEQQALIMEVEPVLAACYTDEIWVRNGVRVNPGNRHKKYSGRIFRYCLPLCIISPSSVMLRAEIFAEIG